MELVLSMKIIHCLLICWLASRRFLSYLSKPHGALSLQNEMFSFTLQNLLFLCLCIQLSLSSSFIPMSTGENIHYRLLRIITLKKSYKWSKGLHQRQHMTRQTSKFEKILKSTVKLRDNERMPQYL